MAYTKKADVDVTNENATIETEINDVDTTVKTNKQVKSAKKKFAPDEMISCTSITPGKMFYVGAKTKQLYTFAGMDDVVDIEFRDLDFAARSKDRMMYKPRFIIQDEDFLALYPALNELYSSLHSVGELKNILKMQPRQMEKAIDSLPPGARDAVKTLAVTAIDNGTLDSIQRVKKLDEIYGTQMLLKLTSI